MYSLRPLPARYKTLFSSCFTFSLCLLAGCSGGVLKFTAGAVATIDIAENSDGKVWQASVTLDGAGSISGLSFKLGGPDSDKFSINATSGEVYLREAVDYEQPEDADKNNEYQVTIEATANNQVVEQNLRVHITDVSLPKVEMVQPKLNENLAKGIDIDVQSVVRLYDAESNQALNAGSVYLNGQPLQQSSTNPQEFTGAVIVPAAGMDVLLEGKFDSAHSVAAHGKIFNKSSAVSPVNFGVVPGAYLFYLDDYDSSVSKLNLRTAISSHYVQDGHLPKAAPIFDFNSSHQAVYTALSIGAGLTQLYGFLVGSSVPEYYLAGCTKDSILNITYDGLNKRILFVAHDDQHPSGDYKVMSLAVDEKKALVGAESRDYCTREIEQNIVWRLTADVIRGKFKQLAFHRISGTFVVADERSQAGRLVTVLQGYSEAGQKRFEAVVGPDISNITINNPKGIIYVAENHSSADGKIKAIDVATGKVTDLLTSVGSNFVGAYSEIRIDNTNQLLYVSDTVSDAFFVVDLATNTMKNMGAEKVENLVVE